MVRTDRGDIRRPDDDARWYVLSQIPLSPEDRERRGRLASIPLQEAMDVEFADFNGHRVCVTFHRDAHGGRWVTEYYWCGWGVLTSGSFERALAGAKREYDRGARGTTVAVFLEPNAPESIERQRELCVNMGMHPVPRGQRPHEHAAGLATPASRRAARRSRSPAPR